MLPYVRIASLLEDISKAERVEKAVLVAGLLSNLPKGLLCPCVRLLTGELWPSWEKREMGMGPEAIWEALDEISAKDVGTLKENSRDIGLIAEVLLRQKSQYPVFKEPLDALQVYQSLRRISYQRGADSEHRKGAILRGLFLNAEPIEAKYIARTVMRNIKVGLGPQTVIAAMSKAFGIDAERLIKAYALMPELGLVADAASTGVLEEVSIKPPRPVRPMLIFKGEISKMPIVRAYTPRYPGIRVQVHKVGKDFFVYTMRLRDITSSVSNLYREIGYIDHDFIADAQLIGFQDDILLGQNEVVRYINRRSKSRRSKAFPALMAWDLLYLDGMDLTNFSYEERHNRLKAFLGIPKDLPFAGISMAECKVLENPDKVKYYHDSTRQKGLKGLIVRDLHASYQPGRLSKTDCYI